MENIKTTTRTAYNPDTGEKYQIDFPALEEIRNALLNLEHPSEGIIINVTAEKLIEHFNLTDEQKSAKMKSKGNYIDIFITWYLVQLRVY